MRTIALPVCLLVLLTSSVIARGADMKVHLRTGGTTTISSGDIRRIGFANVTLGVADPSSPGLATAAIQLLGSYPNPFKPSTTIEYQVARRADVSIRVFDLRGSLVKELLNENVAAGRHQVTWDGTDRNQARVSSGIYFYRVECGTQALSRRLVLIK